MSLEQKDANDDVKMFSPMEVLVHQIAIYTKREYERGRQDAFKEAIEIAKSTELNEHVVRDKWLEMMNVQQSIINRIEMKSRGEL